MREQLMYGPARQPLIRRDRVQRVHARRERSILRARRNHARRCLRLCGGGGDKSAVVTRDELHASAGAFVRLPFGYKPTPRNTSIARRESSFRVGKTELGGANHRTSSTSDT